MEKHLQEIRKELRNKRKDIEELKLEMEKNPKENSMYLLMELQAYILGLKFRKKRFDLQFRESNEFKKAQTQSQKERKR